MTDPVAYLRRAPLRRALQQAGAIWAESSDTAVAVSMPGTARRMTNLFMADLSALPRLGFKGRGTITAMKARGVTVEAEPNKAFAQPDGGLCLVLAASEVILLADPLAADTKRDATALDAMLASWKLEDEEQTYPLLRHDSHAWLAVGGTKAAEMLAKMCAIDLAPHKFPNFSIAQTSVAKVSAIVTRADIGSTLTFHLLADSAAALYFWGCLMDAAHDLGGQIVGLTALQELSLHDKTSRRPPET